MYNLYGMNQVKELKDYPVAPHYAVMVFRKLHIHHEGDERSRTNPGHGYPAHTETYNILDYYYTNDKKIWEDCVLACLLEKNEFKALHVDSVPIVKTSVSLNMSF